MSPDPRTTDLDPAQLSGTEFAAHIGAQIGQLGGAFMIGPYAKAFAKQHNLRGYEAYMIGRFGVLGDVDADVVIAGAGFWPADLVRDSWDTARTTIAPAEAASSYVGVNGEWAAGELDGWAQAGESSELLWQIADNADVAGLPVFAGWRAMPRPAPGLQSAALALHVLREQRGGMHLIAVLASGLSPLEALLAGPGGEGNATFFRWPPPFANVAALRPARAAAEALTNDLMAATFDVLGEQERRSLVEALRQAQQCAFA